VSWRLPEAPSLWMGRIGAMVVLVVMSLATMVVWWNEIEHDRQAVRDHATDVCRQASRRLEVVVEGSMTAASLFARRLATRGEHSSRERFEEFASVMVAEVPGFSSARLIPSDGTQEWLAPQGADSAWQKAKDAEPDLLERGHQDGVVVLSAPVVLESGVSRFFAVLPIVTPPHHIGSLVVEFDASAIIDDGFHERIRSEFEFEVFDGQKRIYQFTPEGPTATHPYRDLGAQWNFTMRNREWRFEVVPRRKVAAQATGLGSAPVLVLGLLLSAGLAGVVNLLARRMNLFREAHDQALKEIAERKRAEEALRASEERYRSVFASATDGLLLIGDDDRIAQANPAACTMHGWEPGALDGVEVFKLITPASRHLYQAFKNRPDAAGIFRAAAIHQRTDGTLIDVEVRGSRFRMGETRRMLAILTDVTERNRAVQRLGTLSRKALMAQEEERARVSRDLHDELGQLLTASRFELGWLQKHAAEMPDEVSNALARAIEAVEKSADELRRICRGLRPPLLDDLGLEPAVRLLAQEFEERTGLQVDMETQLDETSPVTMEVALCTYRVLQESLNNINRHANARDVDVSLVGGSDELLLSVYDDGKGFDVEALEGDGGVGIVGMRERASLVGGIIEIRSAPSQGTRVVLRVPLSDANLENGS
jgi:PAS domain S-box-containing protein